MMVVYTREMRAGRDGRYQPRVVMIWRASWRGQAVGSWVVGEGVGVAEGERCRSSMMRRVR